MPHDYHIVHIAPDSDLGRLLDKAAGSPVLLEKAGVRYRLVPEEEDIWAGYDPAAVKRALRAGAGTLSADEAERLKAAIYAAREEGSRPATRP
jgi:hypothetical protein